MILELEEKIEPKSEGNNYSFLLFINSQKKKVKNYIKDNYNFLFSIINNILYFHEASY